MRNILTALCLSLALSSCVSQGGGSVVVATTVDAKIAAASEKLAKECTLLAIAIESGRLFTNSAKVQRALDVAEAGRATFCASPPTNVNSAIVTVANMAVAVNVALAQK